MFSGRLRLFPLGQRPYPLLGFQRPKIPKKLAYWVQTSMPTNTPPHHMLDTAPSKGYRYTFELSIDPPFLEVPQPTACHRRFRRPARLGFPWRVGHDISVVLSHRVSHVSPAFARRHGPDWIPGFALTRSLGHFLPSAVSWSPNTQCGWPSSRSSAALDGVDRGLSRRRHFSLQRSAQPRQPY